MMAEAIGQYEVGIPCSHEKNVFFRIHKKPMCCKSEWLIVIIYKKYTRARYKTKLFMIIVSIYVFWQFFYYIHIKLLR